MYAMGLLIDPWVKICQLTRYANYELFLPDKPLDRPYDVGMGGFRE
ncbi:MAG: hypothetical protein WA952_12915 [Lewinella sp.]